MAGMVGADLEQVRALAASFDRAAAQLNQTSTKVRNGIQISAWVGPFAVRFRHTWDSDHSVKLRQAATALAAQAKQLRLEADQQDRASAASTGLRYSGGRVSDRDLVDFARSGTSDQNGVARDGYTEVSRSELARMGVSADLLHDEFTGFDAKVYRDASGRVIVSFGGTEPDQVGDFVSDGTGAVANSTQTGQTLALALALKKAVGTDDLVFTGHSLGGRNAAIASVATGARAVTFNAAGVSAADYALATAAGPAIGQGMGGGSSRITNYYTDSDPLSQAQNPSPFALVGIPRALGTQREVHSDLHWLEGHADFEAFRNQVPD